MNYKYHINIIFLLINAIFSQIKYRPNQEYNKDGTIYQPFYSQYKISRKLDSLGTITGRSITIGREAYINVFRGIPYAKPPFGSLRFKKPQPPDIHWGNSRNRELDCTHFRDACPQQFWKLEKLIYDYRNVSEDCLHMNIFSPNRSNHRHEKLKYPVLIFVHGDEYSSGDSQLYPGHMIASRDVVVVTFNYRLGVFGFLSTSDSNSPGNYGLWDIIEALEFVQKYISVFSGDSSKITIVGTGSGAASIGLLALSQHSQRSRYNSKPLFHQVGLMGGSDQCDWAFMDNPHRPLQYAYDLGRMVGCDVEGLSVNVLVECLHGKHHEEIVNATANMWKKDGDLSGPFAPVVDGRDGLFPERPDLLRIKDNIMKFNIIAGITMDEGAYMAENITRDILGLDMNFGLDSGTFRDIIYRIMRRQKYYNPLIEEMTSAIFFQYTYWSKPDNISATRQKLIDMYSDMYYGSGVDATLKYHIDSQDTDNRLGVTDTNAYMYVFDHRSQFDTIPEWMGAPHGKDVEYLFSYPFFNLTIGNITGLILQQDEWSNIDRNISEYMLNLFANFTVNSGDVRMWDRNVSWAPMNVNNLTYLWIKEHSELGYNFRQNKYSFWRQYLPSLANKPNILTTLLPTVLPNIGYQIATWFLSLSTFIGIVICIALAISLWKRRRSYFFKDIFS